MLLLTAASLQDRLCSHKGLPTIFASCLSNLDLKKVHLRLAFLSLVILSGYYPNLSPFQPPPGLRSMFCLDISFTLWEYAFSVEVRNSPPTGPARLL